MNQWLRRVCSRMQVQIAALRALTAIYSQQIDQEVRNDRL